MPIDGLDGPRKSILTSHQSSSLASSSIVASTPSSHISSQDTQLIELRHRIRQLEEKLLETTPPTQASAASTATPSIQKLSSSLSGTFHVLLENGSLGQPQTIARSVSHKTRLFGQSHWAVNSILMIPDIFELIDKKRAQTSKVWAGIERCKAIARLVKSQRAPPVASFQTPELPSKEVSDALVDCYLRSTESVFRILHVPSFRQAYDAMWIGTTAPSTAFLVQLSLVLALGATTYDDQFSLRPPATRWVGMARIWLAGPRPKADLDIPGLQTDILYLLAHERVGLAGDMPYVLVGTLLRRAISIGLHRDPSFMAPKTVFAAEMRRRIWNTILELAVQSSLTSGSPPLLSPDDYDTLSPANFDDDELLTASPVPLPAGHFSQTSVAIALRSTFPQRLAVVKFLNDLASPVAYEKTLELDAELRSAYKSMVRILLAYNRSSTHLSPSQFEIRLVDFSMHRYFLCLHSPYMGAAFQDSVYAFSRKVVVETSLTIWRANYPPANEQCDHRLASETNELQRLITCTSGFFPTGAVHASLLIALELRNQLKEEQSLEPVRLRPDLVAVLREATVWQLEVIKAGETNVKGYLLMSMVSTQIHGLIRCLNEEQIADMLIETVENVEAQCLPILKTMLTTDPEEWSEESAFELGQSQSADLETTVQDMGCFSFDSFPDFGDPDPMGWAFNIEGAVGIPSHQSRT